MELNAFASVSCKANICKWWSIPIDAWCRCIKNIDIHDATNTIWIVGKLHDLIRSCFIVLDAWHFKVCYCLYYFGVCLKHWRKRKMEIKTNIPFIYMSLRLCLEALLVLRFTEPFPSYSLKPTIRRLFKEILSQSLNIQINISYTFAWGRLDGRMNGQNNFKQPYDLIKLSLVT